MTPGNEAEILVSQDISADALYRQGMSYYRARDWAQARDSFVRLRALDPERRGVDTLLAELDHFIRLDAVRPGVEVERQAPEPEMGAAPVARPVSRRQWLLWLGLAVLLLGGVALLGNSWSAAQATVAPTPTVVAGSTLLISRITGNAKLHRAGTDVWQDAAASIVLNNGDRLRPANGGAVGLRLEDGTLITLLTSDTMVEFVRSATGQADLLQVGGSVLLQVQTIRLGWATPSFVLREAQPGTVARVDALDAAGYLDVQKGRTSVWIGSQVLQVSENEQLKAAAGEPPSVTRRVTPTAVIAIVAPATATASATASATPSVAPTAAATNTAAPAGAPATSTPPPPTATQPPAAPTWTPVPVASATFTPAPPVTPPSPTAPPTNTPVPPPTATPKR